MYDQNQMTTEAPPANTLQAGCSNPTCGCGPDCRCGDACVCTPASNCSQ